MRFLSGTAVLLLLAAGSMACEPFQTSDLPNRVVVGDTTGTMEIVGTLQHVNVEQEDGCWRLEADTASYQPMNLPASFRSDGLEVRVRARRTDTGHICMTGRLIEIRSIERR